MRAIVCGGRYFNKVGFIYRSLDIIREIFGLTLVISGGARGVDSIAVDWAKHHSLPYEVFMADWDKFNKGAGPIRNAQMLAEGSPDCTVAFPGGVGTADMVKKSHSANVKVIKIIMGSEATPIIWNEVK